VGALDRDRPVLVTGGAGFIGSVLVAGLRADGAEVVVADQRTRTHPGVSEVVGDLTEPVVVTEALACGPSTIFHLAARTSVLQSKRDPHGVYVANVAMTEGLLEAGRAAGVGRFVLASTNAVVGDAVGTGLMDERSPLRPLTPYGATKAAAEMLCNAYAASYGLATATIRLTNVYGPTMIEKDTMVVRVLRAAARDEPVTVYGDGKQQRDYVYVEDAVSAMRIAASAGHVGPMVAGAGRSTSVLELIDLARSVTGRAIPVMHVDGPPGEMRAVRVDITCARALGWTPQVDLVEGLARTWAGLRGHLEGR
jgi:UDP-glucose 4-epimerase